jgi:hypothetical protein
MGSQRSGFHRLNGKVEIARWRLRVRARRRCKMQHRIHLVLHEDIVRDIVLVEGEFFIPYQVSDISWVACDEIIQPDDLMPFVEKAVT